MYMNKQTQEVLIILQEECAEVIQAISKCFRFGLDSTNPITLQPNIHQLEQELGDVIVMIDLLLESGTIDRAVMNTFAEQKIQKLKKWSTIYE